MFGKVVLVAKNINNAYMLRDIYIGIKDLYKPEKKLKPKKE